MNMTTFPEKINCSVCGEEVDVNDNFCSSCGVVLKKKTKSDSSRGTKGIESKSKDLKNENFSGRKSKENTKKNTSDLKKISFVKLFYVAFSLLLVGMVIIFSSGVIDNGGSVSSSAQNTDDVHSGVDLQYLQRINSLEEELKVKPDKSKLLELAHLLNDSGLKPRAIEKYQEYLKIDPKNADVLVDMGVCYYELGKYDDALRFMKDALKFQPKHQIAHLNIGIVSLSAGMHDEAVDWWKKAVAINPNSDVGKRAQELINSH